MQKETENVAKTQGVETTKKKAERKVSLGVSMLKEMTEEPELLTQFVKALEEDTEAIAPILFAQAKGALRQLKLTIK